MTSEPASEHAGPRTTNISDAVRRGSLAWAAAALLLDDETGSHTMANEALDGADHATMLLIVAQSAARTLVHSGVETVTVGEPSAARLGASIVEGVCIYTEVRGEAHKLLCRLAAMTVSAFAGNRIGEDAAAVANAPEFADALNNDFVDIVAPFLLAVAEISSNDGRVDPLDKASVGLAEIRAVNFSRILCAKMRAEAENPRAA